MTSVEIGPGLAVRIDGREAIPVRAIPYITGWTISPDAVAQELARRVGAPFAILPNTLAYHLHAGEPEPVRPKEWEGLMAEFAAREDALRASAASENVAYAEWRKTVVEVLPAGVFVWKDDFEGDIERAFSGEELSSLKRYGDRELTYAPMFAAQVRAMVLEGFAQPSTEDLANSIDIPGDKQALPTKEGLGSDPPQAAPNGESRGGTGKRWTEAELDKLREYRRAHTAAETAQAFNIGESRIRQLLGRKGESPAPASVANVWRRKG